MDERIEEKFTDLEMRIAFAEDTIEGLNMVVAKQQMTIDALHKQLNDLRDLMKANQGSNIAKQSEETPPPHY